MVPVPGYPHLVPGYPLPDHAAPYPVHPAPYVVPYPVHHGQPFGRVEPGALVMRDPAPLRADASSGVEDQGWVPDDEATSGGEGVPNTAASSGPSDPEQVQRSIQHRISSLSVDLQEAKLREKEALFRTLQVMELARRELQAEGVVAPLALTNATSATGTTTPGGHSATTGTSPTYSDTRSRSRYDSRYEEKDTGSAYQSTYTRDAGDDATTGTGYTSSGGSSVYSGTGSYVTGTAGGSSVVSGATGRDTAVSGTTKQDLINEIRRLERLAKAHAAGAKSTPK